MCCFFSNLTLYIINFVYYYNLYSYFNLIFMLLFLLCMSLFLFSVLLVYLSPVKHFDTNLYTNNFLLLY